MKKDWLLLILGLALFFAVSVSLGCASNTPISESTPLVPGIEIPLRIIAMMDKNSYLPGEDITITLSIQNVTKSPFVVYPYVPEVTIRHFGGGNGENVRIFAAGSDTRSLDPGQAVTYTVMWDQMDNQCQTVPYGSYDVAVGLFQTEAGGTTSNLNILISRAEVIIILPSQEVMEKTIEVNKTVAAAEGTITLERITLSATQIKVDAIYTPQGYVMPVQSGNSPSPTSIDALGEYSVGGNILKSAGPAFDQWVEKGIKLVWVQFDAVPNNSIELTFRIIELGDWEGPWVFKIPLE